MTPLADAKRTLFDRILGETIIARLGTLLITGGLLALAYAWGWDQGLVPGSRVEVPPPVALQRSAERLAQPAPVAEKQSAAAPAPPVAAAEPAAEPVAAPAIAVPLEPADI